jgi:hypothetical protein
MLIIERIPANYEAQEVSFGRAYKWSPEQVVLQCSECTKKMTCKRSQIIGSEVTECECGKGSTARIREVLVLKLLDEEYEAHQHPWRYWHTTKDSGIPV